MTDRVELVCRANLCRSPVAAALLRAALRREDAVCDVGSCGTEAAAANEAPAELLAISSSRGIDLAGHRAVECTPARIDGATLVLTMTRELLRTVVVSAPTMWPRSFTLLEFVRRASSVDDDAPTLDALVALAHAGRDRAALLGADEIDDVADPTGAGEDAYAAMFNTLDAATSQLARLLASVTTTASM